MTALAPMPRLKPKQIEIPGTELDFVGPYGLVKVTKLPLITVGAGWYEDLRIVGPNGRRRAAITIPGHNRGVRPLNAGRKYPPEPLTNAEALALLDVIRPTSKTNVRNRALLALLWRTGLRVSEALDLKPHHVDHQAKRVTVLHGKGDKRLERAMLGIPNDAPLFCTVQLPGRGNRMNSAYVREVLHEYGRRAGIPKRAHPHGWRHTLACDLVREGFSIVNVQAQLGHSNVATTATYLRGMGADEAFERVAARPMPGGVR